MVPDALSLCSLLAANCEISVLVGQKMQMTGCDYGNAIGMPYTWNETF